MSGLNITHYFPFRRVRIASQRLDPYRKVALIDLRPDRRYRPLCHWCESRDIWIHSHRSRRVRDLDMADIRVYLNCQTRRIFCAECGVARVEGQEFVEPYARVTRRLARYVYERCRVLTVQEIARHLAPDWKTARHLALDWKTVKAIDKHFLEEEFGETGYSNLRILAIDQVRNREHREATEAGKAVLKGSKYLLLKNRGNLKEKERPRLREVLELNRYLATMYILKDMLKRIWKYRYRGWAQRRLNEWCELA